jgi:Cytosine specific DNA methyltransferase replication foci domain
MCVGICSPIYLETTAAWYILGLPTPEYRALYTPFFRAHKIAQTLVCALMRDARTPLEALLDEIALIACVSTDGNSNVLSMRDVNEAVRRDISYVHCNAYDPSRRGARSRQSSPRLTPSSSPWRDTCAVHRFSGSS